MFVIYICIYKIACAPDSREPKTSGLTVLYIYYMCSMYRRNVIPPRRRQHSRRSPRVRRRRREYCLKIYYRTLMPLSYFNMLHKLSEGSFFFLIVSIIGHKILTFSVSPRDGDLLQHDILLYIAYAYIIYYYVPAVHPRAASS